jgi:hypothetical protein
MREAFCAGLLLPDIHPQWAQESSANWTSTVSSEPVTFPEPRGARVRLRHPTWTDRLAKTRSHPRYVTMYERSVQQKEMCLPSVWVRAVPYFQGQTINLLVSLWTHSVPK